MFNLNKMKKYILPLALTALLSSSVFADNFYLKGGIGLNSLNHFKIHEEELEGNAKLLHNFPLLEAGIGYHFNDRIRTELVFYYYFMFNTKESFNTEYASADSIRKTKINVLFFNAYADVIKFEKSSIFLGGGMGSSFQREKINVLAAGLESYIRTQKTTKQINRFSYKLTTGVNFKLNTDLNFEVTYNYFDLGKNSKKYKQKLHNVTIGIRYTL